jgi:hypothetical protein
MSSTTSGSPCGVLLHGQPDQAGDRVWSRVAMQDSVDAAAADASGEPPSIDPVVDSLLADGFAVELAPGTDAAVDFAGRHRMVPRMLGLGNSPTEPWMYEIGFFDNPIVKVTDEVYQLWQACAIDDTLMQTCESIAASARESTMTDPERIDPARVAAGFLATIHDLLMMSVVYLEPRR